MQNLNSPQLHYLFRPFGGLRKGPHNSDARASGGQPRKGIDRLIDDDLQMKGSEVRKQSTRGLQ